MSAGAGWTADPQVLGAVEGYLQQGWPILPLNSAGDHLVAGMVPPDVATAVQWWSERPYGIACRVGAVFDLVEISPRPGKLVLAELTWVVPSIIEVPGRGWSFLVTCGSPLLQEFAGFRRAARLRRNGWVPMPPTPLAASRVSWVSKGTVAHSLVVQSAAVRVLRRLSIQALIDDLGADGLTDARRQVSASNGRARTGPGDR